jgi:hypothetical protein
MNFVLVVTVYNFVSWLFFLILPRLRYSFFSQRIQIQQSVATVRTGMRAFVYDYLQQDGFFILRLVHSNVGEDVTATILTNLWKNFQRGDKSTPGDSGTGIAARTVSLTAAGNRGTSKPDGQGGSIFDYSKSSSTNL